MKNEFLQAFKDAFELEEDFEIKMEDEFRDYDNWDSLTKLSLIAAMDESFEIIIEDDEFEKILTIQELLNFITNAKG